MDNETLLRKLNWIRDSIDEDTEDAGLAMDELIAELEEENRE